jgi:hypothetical protein
MKACRSRSAEGKAMYVASLAALLVVVAAGVDQAQPPAAGACVIGADQDDVAMMLGEPDSKIWAARGAVLLSHWHWSRLDWLGGRRTRRVNFVDGVAEADRTTYEPFVETPPWLDALRDAFGLQPASLRWPLFRVIPS